MSYSEFQANLIFAMERIRRPTHETSQWPETDFKSTERKVSKNLKTCSTIRFNVIKVRLVRHMIKNAVSCKEVSVAEMLTVFPHVKPSLE